MSEFSLQRTAGNGWDTDYLWLDEHVNQETDAVIQVGSGGEACRHNATGQIWQWGIA